MFTILSINNQFMQICIAHFRISQMTASLIFDDANSMIVASTRVVELEPGVKRNFWPLR